jgi:hypothetical protein
VTRVAAAAIVVVVLAAAAVAAVFAFSGVSLRGDPVALARLDVQTFGGTVQSVRATTAGGTRIPLGVRAGRLTPQTPIAPGERISVTVVVKRPGWSAWALGSTRRETLTVVAPTVHIAERWVTAHGGRASVRFDTPIGRASAGGRPATVHGRSVTFPAPAAAGTIRVAAAARTWELLGAAEKVTWFPPATGAAVLVRPKPGAQINPVTPLSLTFSRPVDSVLGSRRPKLSERVPGRWLELDSHTLVFRPSGYGAPFARDLHVRLPARVDVVGTGITRHSTTAIAWSVAPASFLRLQQLLAEEGYLPLDWTPAADDAAHTVRAQLEAAIDPPDGHFDWRYPNTPAELQALWRPGEPNTIVRGAVMMFEDEHDLAVDGIAGARVWQAVLADAVAGKRKTSGYSYVYVHRNVPQLLTLWHNGSVVLTSPGNTGVPAAPTALGTFEVFEHIPVGRMSGTNPDGSHYDDPGIRWISYFHGGEALHAFNRASFGTPQSLGCVELPLASAAKVWPYTPIGTLVTIEN